MKPTFVTVAVPLIAMAHHIFAVDVAWCKNDKCDDCPTDLTSSGPGYPECVIYDSNTVFGGQGFKTGSGKIKFLPNGKFGDPCNGQPGSIMIRSPATLNVPGCGDLIYHSQKAQCSQTLPIEDTFSDCGANGIPVKRSPEGKLEAGATGSGVYFHYANGSVIQPLAVGSAPKTVQSRKKRQTPPPGCQNVGNHGYVLGSFQVSKELYKRTFETRIVTPSVGPFEKDEEYKFTDMQSVDHTTTFSITIGDPWGVITAMYGETWGTTNTTSYMVSVPVLAGQSGRIGFTPIYECMEGSMEMCSGDGGGRSDNKQVCKAWRTAQGGPVQGDYRLVQN